MKNIKINIKTNLKVLSLILFGVGLAFIYSFIAFSNPELTSTQVVLIMIDFFFN